MKRIAVILAIIMLANFFVSCGRKGGESSMDAQDSKAMEAAQKAYADSTLEKTAGEILLYEAGGRFVALRDGTAVGVYDSTQNALTALFDDPDTTENEAGIYICVPVTDSAWHICCTNFRGLTYVAFGDSITFGIDGNFKHTEDGYKMAKPYPSLVGEILELGEVNNQAVSGASFCPCDGRTNMTEKILGFFSNADIISLMLGVNDFSSQSPLGDPSCTDNTTIYGSLHLISEYLTGMYPDALIFYMTPFPYEKVQHGAYELKDIAQAIKTVAARYDIPVLDLYTEGKYELEMHTSPNDGLHPSQQHHMAYTAPLVSEFIVRHFDPEKKPNHR